MDVEDRITPYFTQVLNSAKEVLTLTSASVHTLMHHTHITHLNEDDDDVDDMNVDCVSYSIIVRSLLNDCLFVLIVPLIFSFATLCAFCAHFRAVFVTLLFSISSQTLLTLTID